jgi:dTDP-4-amino-4,6-dideoxygalactose transaminase
VGGSYRGESIGNGRYSDITVFSFHPVKIITTGEGGMALTNDDQLANAMDLLRSHGITRDPARMTHAHDGGWYYQQVALGYNYRMTELQGALGTSQLQRIDDYVARRHQLAAAYDRMLEGLPVVRPWQHPDGYSGLHLYVVRIDPERCTRSRGEVFAAMRAAGIGVNLHYIPVHTQPYYQAMGFKPGDFPEAERYYAEAITLPMFPTLSDSEQQSVVGALESALVR